MLMNTSEYISIIENIKNEIKAAQYGKTRYEQTASLFERSLQRSEFDRERV